MTIDLNMMVALAGCIALCLFWLTHLKSGIRGFLLVCAGCAVIFVGYEGMGRVASLAGIVLACVVMALVLLSVAMLARARRRRIPRYQAPHEIDGRCSRCAKTAHLTHTKRGWLCAKCSRRYGMAA